MNPKRSLLPKGPAVILMLIFATCFVSPGWAQTCVEPLAGSWCGSWQSDCTGHRGKLSATFYRIDASHVQARFRGSFAKIVPFRYQPILRIVHEETGLLILEGSQRLPLVGEFQYRATVREGSFSATYQSRRDRGSWTMTR